MILQDQETGRINAGLLETEAQRSARVFIGDYTVNITRAGAAIELAARVAGMFLQTAPNEFLVVGAGDAQITFSER